jgi:hypothetical protein
VHCCSELYGWFTQAMSQRMAVWCFP